jgi:arginyl-tRNA--protein-N-Asp/Glu arginylyltransferase
VARLLEIIHEEPRPCSYLADRPASLEHHLLLDVSPEELEARLERGWRRFGPDYFRPRCPGCTECIPVRIPVATFRPSKSQRRARRACESLHITIGPPRYSDERLDLYRLWHAAREQARGWEHSPLDRRRYELQFAFPHPAARELQFREVDTGRLVGVALCDQTPRAWSAIYFFYHPDWAHRSIGTADVVVQIELAEALGIPYVYLGYRVDDCPSLRYKSRFRPQERLVGFPELEERATWIIDDAAEPTLGAPPHESVEP